MIKNRFDEVSNENKERAKLSVSKRRQTTIFSEDHEVGIPSPQDDDSLGIPVIPRLFRCFFALGYIRI